MRVFDKNNIRHLALAVVSAALLVGCNGGDSKTDETGNGGGGKSSATAGRKAPTAAPIDAQGPTIKIGLVASVTGDNKPWGDDSKEGAQLAVDEFNAAGGMDGKKIEMVLGDSASKPEQAKTAAEKLMSDGCIALVGEVSSGNTIQMAKAAFDKGIAVVAVGATRTDLTDEGSHVFRVCYTDAFQGPVMAKFLFDKLNKKTVAIMTDNHLPYSQGLSKSFKETFEKLGGKVVAEKAYESGGTQAPNYSGQLTEIKSANPDAMFCSGYFTEVGPMAQQARQAGIKAVLLGGDGWDSDKLLTSGGDAILGSFFCNHYNNADNRPQVTDFLKKWKAVPAHNGKNPDTTMGALGYDAMALTLDALKRAGKANSKAIIDALEATEKYPGVSGDITLKGMNGNPPKRAIVVSVTAKGPDGSWQKFAKDYTPDQIK